MLLLHIWYFWIFLLHWWICRFLKCKLIFINFQKDTRDSHPITFNGFLFKINIYTSIRVYTCLYINVYTCIKIFILGYKYLSHQVHRILSSKKSFNLSVLLIRTLLFYTWIVFVRLIYRFNRFRRLESIHLSIERVIERPPAWRDSIDTSTNSTQPLFTFHWKFAIGIDFYPAHNARTSLTIN